MTNSVSRCGTRICGDRVSEELVIGALANSVKCLWGQDLVSRGSELRVGGPFYFLCDSNSALRYFISPH